MMKTLFAGCADPSFQPWLGKGGAGNAARSGERRSQPQDRAPSSVTGSAPWLWAATAGGRPLAAAGAQLA